MNTFKIEIDGKAYTLLFGFTCYTEFMERCFMFKDTYLTDDDKLTILGLANLFHCAYLDNCYDKKLTIALRYDDFAKWMRDQYKTDEGQQVVLDALEVWAKSKEVKEMQEEIEKKSQLNGTANLQNQTLQT